MNGCLKEFDELAQLFVRNSGKDRSKILNETQEKIASLEKKDIDAMVIGKKYLKIMKKTVILAVRIGMNLIV